MKPNSKDLMENLILTFMHRQCCPKLPPLYTPHYHHQHPIPLRSLLPSPFWWCLAPAVTHRKHYEFSTFYEALAYSLTSQLDVGLETVRKTLPSTSGCIWF